MTVLEAEIAGLYERFSDEEPCEVEVEVSRRCVVAELRGVTCRLERSLLRANRHDLVRENRQAMRELLAGDLRTAVEGALGRRVAGPSGLSDLDQDIETLFFRFRN